MFQVTQRNGQRFSAADAFLRPALKRPNLEVRTGVAVLGVELEGERAVGVRVAQGPRRRRARCAPSARCCCRAGSIDSPQLLLLSGIGPADELRAAGVQVRHDLPGVGRNLQDHPFVTVIWEVSDPTTLYGADKPKALAEWLLRRSGKLSSTVAEVVAFTRTRGGLPAADIQFHMGAAYYEDHGAETYDGHCMVDRAGARVAQGARAGVAALGRPDAPSRASSPTRCPSPTTSSRWSPAWQLAREIAAQSPLRETFVQELKPGSATASPRGAGSRPAPAPDADLPPGRHLRA